MKKYVVLFVCLIIAVSNTFAQKDQFKYAPALKQVSIIDALLAGEYDGTYTLANLTRQGDFGIGTFDKLDGEMIVFEGRIYQFKADGKIYKADLKGTTPFASVVKFKSAFSCELNHTLDMKAFQTAIDSMLKNKNLFYAIKVTGDFTMMKTRSVPAQVKPYKPLSEVTKAQPVFVKNNQKGTLIGFRLPTFVGGINVPGYHMHFLSDDKTFGGHILDFSTSKIKVEIQELNKFEMLLPEGESSFNQVDLSKDRSRELERVEK
jgi:acetolactate decarboxylase